MRAGMHITLLHCCSLWFASVVCGYPFSRLYKTVSFLHSHGEVGKMNDMLVPSNTYCVVSRFVHVRL
jgi:hypothetical protein